MLSFKACRASGLNLVILAFAVVLGGCSGSSGSPGAQGEPGPAGPPGPPGTTTGGSVTALTLKITSATLGTTSTVNFSAVDQSGNGFIGIPASALEVTLAKLIPGSNGDNNAWQSYINAQVMPTAGLGSGTQPAIQATTDKGGSLVNNGDGTYTYTFGTNVANVATPISVPFDPTLTHRVAIAIRSSSLPPANNAVYTWQPSSGTSNGILTQDMVDSQTCNACHGHLSVHGGPRQDPRLCVTCHNPGSVEPNSGNTLDFKVMIHKIHDGAKLPSVMAGTPYVIYGHGNSKNDYSDVVFPQDVRNCTTCHNPGDADTPDAGRYASAPTIQACGSCHDNIDFAKGQTGGHVGGVVTDNAQCTVCHAADRIAGSVEQSHAIIGQVDAAKFAYHIISITNTLPGEKPSVTFSVTNPKNNDAPYNIQTDPAFTASGGNSRLGIDLAWSNSDYENIGSGSYPGQPVSINALSATSNGDGTYTATSPVAIPNGTTGSGAAVLEGHPADTTVNPVVRIPVTSVVKYFAITDAQPVARRTIVETSRCQNCHGHNDGLSFHGNNRTDNTQVCVVCHDPDATDLSQRPSDPDVVANGVNTAAVDKLEQRPIDFKYMIHAIHSADYRTGDYVIYGFGGSPNDFGDVRYPGVLADCSQCHARTTYVPPLAASDLGTTIDTNTTIVASAGTRTFAPADTIMNPGLYRRISPTAAACSACHSDATSQAHMQQNGGSFGITQAMIGSTAPTTETCEICHGSGRIEDVTVAHGVP
ncbi:MAG: OmcA/MtrC family decaheme c-type cytochrome [Rudaea sp.]